MTHPVLNSPHVQTPLQAHQTICMIRAHLDRADQCNRQIDGLLKQGNLEKVREHARLTQVFITNARQRADDLITGHF
jgi:hypothetical protein